MVEQKNKKMLVRLIQHQDYKDFWLQELRSLALLFDLELPANLPAEGTDCPPYVFDVGFPSAEVASQVCQRAIIVKEVIEVVRVAGSSEELLPIEDELLLELSDRPYMFVVEGIGHTIGRAEVVRRIELFDPTALRADTVDLTNPQRKLRILDNIYRKEVIFGVQVATYKRSITDKHSWHQKYALKDRPYLGPTTLKHELSFLMANQCQIKAGDFVFDPFVGSGSLAVAAAHFGAHIFGADLDARVLMGTAIGHRNYENKKLVQYEKYDVFTNFSHYGLDLPQILIQNVHYPQLRQGIFDAILCDPPYGVRHRSKKQVKNEKKNEKGEDQVKIEDEEFDTKIIYDSLLKLGEKMLKKNGILAFLFHTDELFEPEKNEIPIGNYTLVGKSSEILGKTRKRHLITLRKSQ